MSRAPSLLLALSVVGLSTVALAQVLSDTVLQARTSVDAQRAQAVTSPIPVTSPISVPVPTPAAIINDLAPRFEPIEDITAVEGETVHLVVPVTDPDETPIETSTAYISDASGVFVSELPANAYLWEEFTWTIPFGTVEVYYITFTATSNGLTGYETFKIGVTHANSAPSKITMISGSKTLNEDDEASYVFEAFDPDDEPLTFEAFDNPWHGTITITPLELKKGTTSVSVVYRPNPDFSGQDSFRLRAFDESGGEIISEVVNIEIRQVDDSPAWDLEDSYTAEEDSDFTIVFKVHDEDTPSTKLAVSILSLDRHLTPEKYVLPTVNIDYIEDAGHTDMLDNLPGIAYSERFIERDPLSGNVTGRFVVEYGLDDNLTNNFLTIRTQLDENWSVTANTRYFNERIVSDTITRVIEQEVHPRFSYLTDIDRFEIEDNGDGVTRVKTDLDPSFRPTAKTRYLEQAKLAGAKTRVVRYDAAFSSVLGQSEEDSFSDTVKSRVPRHSDSRAKRTADERVLRIRPMPNASGTARLNVSLSEPSQSVSKVVLLHMTPKNDAPRIEKIADQTITKNGAFTTTFTVADFESLTGFEVTIASSNQGLIANSGLMLTGDRGVFELVATPLAGQIGTSEIIIRAKDPEGAETIRKFKIHVVNHAKGDVNRDGNVDVADLAALDLTLGSPEVVHSYEMDIDNDGLVDTYDRFRLSRILEGSGRADLRHPIRYFELNTQGHPTDNVQLIDNMYRAVLQERGSKGLIRTWDIEYEKKGATGRGANSPSLFNFDFENTLFNGMTSHKQGSGADGELNYAEIRVNSDVDAAGGVHNTLLREYFAYKLMRSFGVPTEDIIGFGAIRIQSLESQTSYYGSSFFPYMILQRLNERGDEIPFTDQFGFSRALLGKVCNPTGNSFNFIGCRTGDIEQRYDLDIESSMRYFLLADMIFSWDHSAFYPRGSTLSAFHNEDYALNPQTGLWHVLPFDFDNTGSHIESRLYPVSVPKAIADYLPGD